MENKKTNRNTRLIIVAIVLALVVLLLCIGGSTFARYISSKNLPSNQATVAKWGYVVTANTKNLFGKNYANTAIVTDTTGDPKLDVKASGNVVAPGTKGEITFGVTGSAEVLAKLNLTFTVKSDVSLKISGDESATPYSPIKWTLKKGDTVLVENKTLADVSTELAKVSTEIEAGTSIGEKEHDYTLSWKWDLGTTTDTNNKLDTMLGYAALGVADTYGDCVVAITGDTTTVTDRSDAENHVSYTAVTKIEFDLSIEVVQIQNNDRAPVSGS